MKWRRYFAMALVVAGLAWPVAAESPPPFPDFKAKRVKPPKPGQTKRITVQIEPQVAAVAVPGTQNVAAATPAVAGQRYGWFWDGVSPQIDASGPGRLEPALVKLSNPPMGAGVAAPRLSDLSSIVEAHGIEILKATVGTKVSPALVLAVIAVESSGRGDAVSGAGAQGLMQLMPATAERFGVSDAMDTPQNIQGGVRFLDYLMEHFERDPILVLAGYNAGENAVRSHGGVPPYAETRDYVPKVLAAFNVARAMCLTPPQLVTDGCVFAMR
ncbi:lytic transglycosylase domain-containing protein [Shimia aestuarii]|uniref:Transglycosylase SLT domain-containing protein n=1 Tax=Shimia aestuarii TaxID=254406 RepID=A0A1I4IGZ4_9RHOB|nr:Transglycosylase SLT domain-containing protein [Shimia aestuarii]